MGQSFLQTVPRLTEGSGEAQIFDSSPAVRAQQWREATKIQAAVAAEKARLAKEEKKRQAFQRALLAAPKGDAGMFTPVHQKDVQAFIEKTQSHYANDGDPMEIYADLARVQLNGVLGKEQTKELESAIKAVPEKYYEKDHMLADLGLYFNTNEKGEDFERRPEHGTRDIPHRMLASGDYIRVDAVYKDHFRGLAADRLKTDAPAPGGRIYTRDSKANFPFIMRDDGHIQLFKVRDPATGKTSLQPKVAITSGLIADLTATADTKIAFERYRRELQDAYGRYHGKKAFTDAEVAEHIVKQYGYSEFGFQSKSDDAYWKALNHQLGLSREERLRLKTKRESQVVNLEAAGQLNENTRLYETSFNGRKYDTALNLQLVQMDGYRKLGGEKRMTFAISGLPKDSFLDGQTGLVVGKKFGYREVDPKDPTKSKVVDPLDGNRMRPGSYLGGTTSLYHEDGKAKGLKDFRVQGTIRTGIRYKGKPMYIPDLDANGNPTTIVLHTGQLLDNDLLNHIAQLKPRVYTAGPNKGQTVDTRIPKQWLEPVAVIEGVYTRGKFNKAKDPNDTSKGTVEEVGEETPGLLVLNQDQIKHPIITGLAANAGDGIIDANVAGQNMAQLPQLLESALFLEKQKLEGPGRKGAFTTTPSAYWASHNFYHGNSVKNGEIQDKDGYFLLSGNVPADGGVRPFDAVPGRDGSLRVANFDQNGNRVDILPGTGPLSSGAVVGAGGRVTTPERRRRNNELTKEGEALYRQAQEQARAAQALQTAPGTTANPVTTTAGNRVRAGRAAKAGQPRTTTVEVVKTVKTKSRTSGTTRAGAATTPQAPTAQTTATTTATKAQAPDDGIDQLPAVHQAAYNGMKAQGNLATNGKAKDALRYEGGLGHSKQMSDKMDEVLKKYGSLTPKAYKELLDYKEANSL